MKRNWKTTLVGGTALALLVGTMTVSSFAAQGRKTANLDYQNMKVTLDGTELILRDSKGNRIEPFTIDGTTYLPLAAIARALDLNVEWNDSTKTVVLTTDDSTSASTYIGESKAKEIALDHAGLRASQVTFYRTVLDWDDSRPVYEVEFWRDNKEYDYEIDALTGAIRDYDYDIEEYTPSTSQKDIGSEEAKDIALDHAGVSYSKAVFVRVEADYDDGRKIYEVEFYSGNKEYDYEIEAATGKIISYDYDAEYYTPSENTTSYIGESKAKQIVESKAGTSGTYHEFKLDWDDGRAVYEGELRSGRMEYEFEIDAVSGTILKWETDWND
ncbi:MAG: PepSY domain-containing protein [Lawsonibacter sp.]